MRDYLIDWEIIKTKEKKCFGDKWLREISAEDRGEFAKKILDKKRRRKK